MELKRIALAAAGAAVAVLAACSNAAAPAAAPGGHGTSSAQARVPVSCGQQYHAWADAGGKQLLAALDAVSVASAAGDSQALTAALAKARPAVARAALHPVPACADPRGYWSVLLMHVNAAAGGKGSASSVRAALQDVPAIHRQLAAELKTASRS